MRATLTRLAAPAAALLLAAGCGGDATEPAPPATRLSAEAAAYLGEALDTMQRRSVNRMRIDWPALRADVVRRAGDAQTFRDTYPAIRFAIDALGDNHSYFVEPGGVVASLAPPRSPPRADRVRDRLGYLRVPGFVGSGDVEFAQQLQDMIRQLDTAAPTCGWVLDLRQNTGGNMWPMLAGVGPLVGTGVVGHFVDPDSAWTGWHHRAGAVGIDAAPSGFRVAAPYELRRAAPPVAVLTGGATASAGEALAVAFRGRPDTRSFGAGTGGLSTGVAGFRLRDGAQLALAVSVFADRARRVYGGVVAPDERVDGVARDDPKAGDAVVDAAAEWLLRHPACR